MAVSIENDGNLYMMASSVSDKVRDAYPTWLAQSEMTQALGMIYQRYDVEELLRSLNKLAKIYGHTFEVDTVLTQILNHPALKNINA